MVRFNKSKTFLFHKGFTHETNLYIPSTLSIFPTHHHTSTCINCWCRNRNSRRLRNYLLGNSIFRRRNQCFRYIRSFGYCGICSWGRDDGRRIGSVSPCCSWSLDWILPFLDDSYCSLSSPSNTLIASRKRILFGSRSYRGESKKRHAVHP